MELINIENIEKISNEFLDKVKNDNELSEIFKSLILSVVILLQNTKSYSNELRRLELVIQTLRIDENNLIKSNMNLRDNIKFAVDNLIILNNVLSLKNVPNKNLINDINKIIEKLSPLLPLNLGEKND